ALCNPGFEKRRDRAAIRKPVLNLSLLQARSSNIELSFRNALAESAISFRPPLRVRRSGWWDAVGLRRRSGRDLYQRSLQLPGATDCNARLCAGGLAAHDQSAFLP